MDEIKKEFRRGIRRRIAEQDEAYLEKSDEKIYDILSGKKDKESSSTPKKEKK